jgi:hypothetical protein
MRTRKINQMQTEKDGTLTVFLSGEAELVEVTVTIDGKPIKNVKKITFDRTSAEKLKQHLNKILK